MEARGRGETVITVYFKQVFCEWVREIRMKYGMKIEGFCNEFRCFKQGEALPIDIRMLANLAERCHEKVRVCLSP